MKIFVVGSGKLSNTILNAGLSIQSCEILKWELKYQSLNERAIFVHAGSGRQLKECFEFCTGTRSIFIELSTGLETEMMEPCFPLVICPNTSILLLKTLKMIEVYGNYFENYKISITESHQSTKRTPPGTAFAFAHSLKFPPHQVVSVRDPEIQRNKIGIPEEYLDKHAYHQIVIQDGSDEIKIETKILGHGSYAKGVKIIIDRVLNSQLENRRYTILDLIDTDNQEGLS